MDRHLRAVRTVIVCGAILTAAALGGGCGTSEESSDEGAPATSTLAEATPAGTDSDDGDGSSIATAAPKGPQSDAPGSDGDGQGADGEGSVEVLLASVEGAAVPLGDIIGVERPAGLEPVMSRADSYQGLCPAEDIPVEAVVQQDPLVENLPVERWILAFASDEAAAEFFDAQRLTEVGCVAERSTTVSVATTEITEVRPLEVLAEVEAFQIAASIAVDLISQDRDPRAVDVVRSIAVEGSAVVVVSSLADYGSVIGVADVHGPVLVDGIELVRAAA